MDTIRPLSEALSWALLWSAPDQPPAGALKTYTGLVVPVWAVATIVGPEIATDSQEPSASALSCKVPAQPPGGSVNTCSGP